MQRTHQARPETGGFDWSNGSKKVAEELFGKRRNDEKVSYP